MQAVNNDVPLSNDDTQTLTISAEVIAYSVLLIVAIVLRLASLGTVPMTDVEATQALSAHTDVNTGSPALAQEASSVMMYWLQRISFTVFGGTEFASRLPSVIGGIVLILTPLLFRKRFGREMTFLMSLILAFSPIAFTATRLSSDVIWTTVFAVTVLASTWQYWDNPSRDNALWLATSLTLMVLLSGSTGILLLLIWIFAVILTIFWVIYTAPDERDTPGDDVLQQVNDFLNSLPIVPMLALSAGLTFVIATGFLFNTAGLNIVAESLRVAFAGFVQPSTVQAPNFWAVMALFIYDPILIILGVMSLFLMLGSQSDSLIDRFIMSWLLIGFVVLFVYRGSHPAQALILVVPLTYLVARLVSELLMNYMPSFLNVESYTSNDPNHYIWIKWVVALIAFAGLIMLSLYLETVGRALLTYSGNFIGTDRDTVLVYARIGWFAIMVVLMVVLYFMFASMFGNRNVLQGYGLGAFVFMLMMGIGTGWNTSVVNISNPAELWYTTGIANDASLLRQALFDVSRRDTRGFPSIDMVIVRDEDAGITGDGLVAWLVRDFNNARFVDTIADARQEEIILLPELEENPDLGGSYVGQRFLIRQYPVGALPPLEWVSWYTQRETRTYQLPQDATVLWLRIDVYDGTPADQRP
ncbi:MAG: glycosyltransferase family 39 protein [Chloroflexota bacterium]